MSQPENIAEASKAAVAFQVAMARVGALTIAEALALWRRLSVTDPAGTAQAWLEDAIYMVMTRRETSRELATAYYRLARALITGSTTPDPKKPEPTQVTLGDLRTAFAELAESRLPRDDGRDSLVVPIEPLGTPVAPPRGVEGTMERDDKGQDLVDMTERELRRANSAAVNDLVAAQARKDKEAEAETRQRLDLIRGQLQRRLEEINRQVDDTTPAREVDAKRAEAHRDAGMKQAAAAERAVLNGGRDELFDRSEEDARAIGFVRYSTTGSPCGFCAMLISRGLILYSSRETALTRLKDGEKYHDNCKCSALPVYSKDQYNGDKNYDTNRLYGEWWPEVTGGTGGKYAQALWRKFHRLQQARGWSEDTAMEKWDDWWNSAEGKAFEDSLIRRLRKSK